MKAVILTTDHNVVMRRIKPGVSAFSYKRKLYNIDPASVVSAFYVGKNKKAEPRIYYFENDPTPITYNEGDRGDLSFELMEHQIRLNAINQQAGGSLGSKIAPVVETLGSWLSLYNVFILIVVVSLVWGYLRGALGY